MEVDFIVRKVPMGLINGIDNRTPQTAQFSGG
jgi:hypothetical protein